MRVQDLRTQLTDLAGAVPPTPRDPILLVMGRVRRHRRRARALTAVLITAVLTSGLALWTTRGGQTSHKVLVSPAPPGPATAATGSARDLAAFEWAPLLAAPIVGRSGASVAWTGREMVVWGGIVNGKHPVQSFTDGAAYDPTSAHWRTIATPPGLAARFGAITLWTGRELLVIGGATPDGSRPPANDGAYDPTTDRWRILPERPSALTGNFTGVWTGQAAFVLSSSRSAASYSPADDRWHSLPPLPEPVERDLVDVIPVWAAGHLLVWVHWEHITTIGNLTTGPWGTDLWDFNPASNTWTELSGAAAGLDNPIWTGTTVLFPGARGWTATSGGGVMIPGQPGLTYSPSTNTYRTMAHGPVDDGAIGGLWTGQALVRIAQSQISGSLQQINPGDAAAWDPATDTWTSLKKSPIMSYDDQLIWTGNEILSYGPATSVRFARLPQS